MLFRYTTIQADTDLGSDGTKIVPLDRLGDVVTGILIYFSTKSAGTSWSDHPAANCIKCEIKNGADVLYSLRGEDAEAMCFYQTGWQHPWRLYYRDTKYNPWSFMINFGRFLGDRELALDPKKFANLSLEFTWDEDVSQTSAVDNTFHVKALVFDEVQPKPSGFLMSKEIKAYSPSSGSWEYTNLPLDYPIRTLAIDGRDAEVDIATTLQSIKLSENNDKRIPVNDLAEDIAALYGPQFGRFTEHLQVMLQTSQQATYITPGWVAGVSNASMVAAKVASAQAPVGCKFNAKMETAAGQASFLVSGFIPHQVIPIPFGRRNEIDEWYKVADLDSLRLSLKGGTASSGTYRILTEQYRTYAA